MNHREHRAHGEEARRDGDGLSSELTESIIGCAIEVHRELGPGLLESTYEACLRHLLVERGFLVQPQVEVPVIFRGVRLDCGFRLELLVNETVIVEIKAVEALARIHEAQLMSYLKLTGKRVGLLINFNQLVLKDGIKRTVL